MLTVQRTGTVGEKDCSRKCGWQSLKAWGRWVWDEGEKSRRRDWKSQRPKQGNFDDQRTEFEYFSQWNEKLGEWQGQIRITGWRHVSNNYRANIQFTDHSVYCTTYHTSQLHKKVTKGISEVLREGSRKRLSVTVEHLASHWYHTCWPGFWGCLLCPQSCSSIRLLLLPKLTLCISSLWLFLGYIVL